MMGIEYYVGYKLDATQEMRAGPVATARRAFGLAASFSMDLKEPCLAKIILYAKNGNLAVAISYEDIIGAMKGADFEQGEYYEVAGKKLEELAAAALRLKNS